MGHVTCCLYFGSSQERFDLLKSPRIIKTKSRCCCSASEIRSASFCSRALAEECRHSQEWKNRTSAASIMACSWWRAFLVQNSTSSLRLLHLYTTSHWFKSTSRRHAIFPLILCRDQICSAESSEDEARCLELRRLARFPSNKEQQSLRNPCLTGKAEWVRPFCCVESGDLLNGC